MREDPALHFADESQSKREHWRSIVLFGRNVASYKFALAKSLLELALLEGEQISLEDLAVPFSRHLCEHLSRVDRQGTFARSRFLDACRFHNAGRLTDDELRDTTVLRGFNNVIDAFHVVGPGDVPTRFFEDERSRGGGIRLTDALMELATAPSASDLLLETETRWRLVEESWAGRAEGEQIIVLYDAPRELLIPALKGKRRSTAEVRPALNGYQKGHCFYCFAPIGLTSTDMGADVDHFLPHSLMSRGFPTDLDSPWNLVLACPSCNRGIGGKFARLPHRRLLERLNRRNEFLIGSNHPLRETLMHATGVTASQRRSFLLSSMELATEVAGSSIGWTPVDEREALF